MKPYYEKDGIVIYHGDCREILPGLAFDVVVTDPPYPDIDKGFAITPIGWLRSETRHQFMFWSATEPFPLSWTAIHIWHKPNGCSAHHYERIFEQNGARVCRVMRQAAILPNYTQFKHEAVDHPTQKPIALMRSVVEMSRPGVVLDPFMGSGTTLVAARDLGRKAIGIEIEERYCEIAARRLDQALLPFAAEPTP